MVADEVDANWVYVGTLIGNTIIGATITGGIVRTAGEGARIELLNNTLTTYNLSGKKVGISWGNGIGNGFGDVSLYDNGIEVLRFENALAGG